MNGLFFSDRTERALRWASTGHDGQTRRGSGVPYVAHVMAVGWILDRAGFDEDTVIAGLLHDLVEDTPATPADVEARFGARVAGLVVHCSEVKHDEAGLRRPWLDRKRDHLAAASVAPVEARAILLADKLHNLLSIAVDLREGRPVWDLFHADRERVLWYHRAMIEGCAQDHPRLEDLARRCREVLAEIERGEEKSPNREPSP